MSVVQASEASRIRTGLTADFAALARRLVRARFARLRIGQVVVREGGRNDIYGTLSRDLPLTTVITVHDPRLYTELVRGGAMGAAEAWIRGYWSCDELTSLVRILLCNRDVLESLNGGASRLVQRFWTLAHRRNRNTRAGSRRNIAAHYDLGNDFYALWLDATMMYSSAIFTQPDMTLEQASVAKLDTICRKLRLAPGDRVLEIGGGWGGFAIHAARHYGCHVTTVTLSEEQFRYVRSRIEQETLSGLVEVRLCDYRDIEGMFDKLVTIEMIEAVGWEYQRHFFEKCSELLRPDGEMLLQAITIPDQHFARYRRGVDFIRRHIFPGGCLTAVAHMLQLTATATDLRLHHLDDLSSHYARTLACWRERFAAADAEVRALGYSDAFMRTWQYYLSYCEGAFLERAIGSVQMHLVKPGARVPSNDQG